MILTRVAAALERIAAALVRIGADAIGADVELASFSGQVSGHLSGPPALRGWVAGRFPGALAPGCHFA